MLKAGLTTETGFCTVCDFAHARPIMHLSILPRAHLVVQLRLFFYIYVYIYIYILIYMYIRVVRRALNLLRASFSPIFQYFSAVNVTRVSFSPIFQYFLTCMPCMAPCAMDSSAMEGAVHSHRDFRVRRSVVAQSFVPFATRSMTEQEAVHQSVQERQLSPSTSSSPATMMWSLLEEYPSISSPPRATSPVHFPHSSLPVREISQGNARIRLPLATTSSI